jgi:hypothetical protein
MTLVYKNKLFLHLKYYSNGQTRMHAIENLTNYAEYT